MRQLTYIVQNSLALVVFSPKMFLKLTSFTHDRYCRRQKLLYLKIYPFVMSEENRSSFDAVKVMWLLFMFGKKDWRIRTLLIAQWGKLQKRTHSTESLRHQRDAKHGVILPSSSWSLLRCTQTLDNRQTPHVGKNGMVVSKSADTRSCALNFCLYQDDLTSAAAWHHVQTGDTTSLLFVDSPLPLEVAETDRPRWHSRSGAALHLCSPSPREVICHSKLEEGDCKRPIATCWDSRVQSSQISLAGWCKIHRMFCIKLREKAHMMHSGWLQWDILHYFPMHSEAHQEENRSRW